MEVPYILIPLAMNLVQVSLMRNLKASLPFAAAAIVGWSLPFFFSLPFVVFGVTFF